MQIFLMFISKKMRDIRQYKKSLAPRLRWTPQLHELFIQSVESLGGRNKATPKRILQKMDIKGLKISHVKSHLQMHRNMKEQPSLHVVMPDFNLFSTLLVSKRLSSKQKECGSQFSRKERNSSDQNGENIHYNDYREEEGSISSGMTKEEEQYCEKERNFWPVDNHNFFDSTMENTHINLDLSLS
ncbi:myb family transcription factor MPH1-like [Nicotiana sylvestris]|uniref:Myb family transcription factor At1g14600 n=1 Tax=Nicotiana sylvestris TaxID=4096 RepID=A0A1U7X2F6_NICSY|nr:PREDICTED: putative Myb family transcription factor At1g14600 [Nicotiana sylvestris]